MGGNSDKASDYMMLWNTGAAIAYLFGAVIGIVTCLEHFSGIQTVVTIETNSSFGQEFALSIIAFVLALIVSILHIIHTQRYFREKDKRSTLGLIASISFLVLVGFQLCRTISGIAAYNNADQSYNTMEGVIMLLNVAIWGLFAFDLINACMGTLAFWSIFRKAEQVEELIAEKEKVVVVKNDHIVADVATHAMGRPAPSKEDVEVETVIRHDLNQTLNDPLDKETKTEEKTEEVAETGAEKAGRKPEEKLEDKLGKLDMIEEAERKEKEEKEIKERKAMGAKKKKLPPILSVNPDNDMLGKINQDGRALAIIGPALAEGGGGENKEKPVPISERREIPRKVEESMMHLDEADIALPVDKSDDEEPENDELMADELPVDELPVDY